MKKKIIAALFLFSSVLVFAQTKINNVICPNTFTVGNDNLVLNGGGTRVKLWIDAYVGVLYLPAKSKDAASIVAANTPMAIRLNIVSSLITSSRMIEAVEDGFQRSTGNNTAPFKDKIEKFKNAFSGEIKKTDIFDIVYAGGKTSIYKNNTLKTEIDGFDFKKAVFGIWLGNDAVDSDLKKGMLGVAD